MVAGTEKMLRGRPTRPTSWSASRSRSGCRTTTSCGRCKV